MAEYNLGTARGKIEITLDDKGIVQGQQSINNLTTSATSGVESLTKGLAPLAPAMIAVGAAITGGMALAVQSAASFEQRLDAIQAATGATSADMKLLESTILDLAGSTEFGIGEIAIAVEGLAKAGFTPAQIGAEGLAKSVANLASAMGTDIPFAGDLMTTSLKTFNLTAADSEKVANLITGAVNSSAISAEDYAQAFNQVGAVASAAGIPIEELATQIAVLGDRGLKGSDAGTSLKSAILQLGTPTSKQAKLQKELNLALFDSAGNMKPLPAVIENLRTATAGMSEQQRLQTLEALAGSDGIRALSASLSVTSAQYDTYAQSIAGTNVEEQARARTDNLAGSVERLKGTLEQVGITVGRIIAPFVRFAVDGIGKVLGVFLALPAPVQAVLAVLTGLGGVVALAAGSFILLAPRIMESIQAFKLLVGFLKAGKIAQIAQTAAQTAGIVVTKLAAAAQWLLNAAMAANPIGLLIIAIVALIAIGIALYKNWDKVVAFFKMAWAVIQAAFEKGKQFIEQVIEKIIGFFVRLVVGAQDKVGEVIEFFKSIPGRIGDFFSGAGRWLYDAGKKILQGLIDGIMSVFNNVRSTLGQVTNLIPDWKGPKQRDRKLLEPAGQMIMEGLVRGLDSRMLRKHLRMLTNEVNGTNFALEPVLAVGAGSIRDAGDRANSVNNNTTTNNQTFAPVINATTDADPHEISRDIAWSQRIEGLD